MRLQEWIAEDDLARIRQPVNLEGVLKGERFQRMAEKTSDRSTACRRCVDQGRRKAFYFLRPLAGEVIPEAAKLCSTGHVHAQESPDQ